MIGKVAALKDDMIQLNNRFKDWDGKAAGLMSVDGIDCPVNEPWPFDKKWHSHKFNGPGVKHEVGVCIRTGFTVWAHGPFVASVGDATIFKETLADLLVDDEGVEVDQGHKGHNKLKTPTTATSQKYRKEKSVARGRHENVNSRLKIFNVLNIPFRHLNPRNKMMAKHGLCFNAIVVIVQLKFQNGEGLYDTEHSAAHEQTLKILLTRSFEQICVHLLILF